MPPQGLPGLNQLLLPLIQLENTIVRLAQGPFLQLRIPPPPPIPGPASFISQLLATVPRSV